VERWRKKSSKIARSGGRSTNEKEADRRDSVVLNTQPRQTPYSDFDVRIPLARPL